MIIQPPNHYRGLAALHWVRVELGCSPDELRYMADGGDLIGGRLVWVWNIARVASDERRRELRFWPLEVKALGTPALKEVQSLLVPNVISQVIGSDKPGFRTDEVVGLLSSDPKSIWHLWQDGELPGSLQGRSLRLTRAGLADFLQRRLLGAVTTK